MKRAPVHLQLAAIGLLAATGIAAADLSGTWTGQLQWPGSSRGVCLYIAQSGSELAGDLTEDGDLKSQHISGTLSSDNLAMTVSDGALSHSRRFLSAGDRSMRGNVVLDSNKDGAGVLLTRYVVPASFYRFGKGASDPRPLRTTKPDYSQEAQERRVEGSVLITVHVTPSGRVGQEIQVIRSLGYGLDEKAIQCVRRWLFTPPRQDCRAGEIRATVMVEFKLPTR